MGDGLRQRMCEVKQETITIEELRGRATCTIEQAAFLLHVRRSTAYAAARDGSLPTLKISHRLLVPAAKLLVILGCDEQAGRDHD